MLLFDQTHTLNRRAAAPATAVTAADPPHTGLKPTDIDILLTNSSIYCPTPSLASMVINMFQMREDVQAYHMGGEVFLKTGY